MNDQSNFLGFGSSASVYQGSSGPSFEALLFAVFYAAVNSLTEEEVVQYVNSSTSGGQHRGGCRPGVAWKPRILAEYRRATEISLLKARLLERGDLITVMAFAILLVSNLPLVGYMLLFR